MKNKTIKHSLDGLIALLLFGVFAVCVLIVLLGGADAYRRLTQRDQEAYARRTCIQYLATKVRQADCKDSLQVEELDGVTALTFSEGDYITRVYCYQGWLMELYADAVLEFDPEAGEKVLEVDRVDLSLSDGLLTVRVDSGDAADVLRLSLRSGEEVAR